MVQALNTFESGSSGTTITTANSAGSGINAFDTVNSGATLQYDNTHAANGSLSMKFATAGTAAAVDVEYTTTIGTQSTIFGRLYIYATANPAASVRISTVATASAAALCSGIYLMTDGTILGSNTSVGTACQTTSAINLNAWTRVEFKVVCSATTGQVEVKLFQSPASATPTQTVTSTAVQNTAGSAAFYSMGMGGDVKASVGPIWLDDIGWSSVAYLGPAAAAAANVNGHFLTFL